MVTKNATYNLKIKMQSGAPVFTAVLGPDPTPARTVETMKEYGFDFLIMDREHTLITDDMIGAYIAAGKELDVPIFLRPEENFASWRRYLDSGVSGLYLGMVNKVEEAVHAVNQSYFPPIGHRGSSIGINLTLTDGQSPQQVPYLSLLNYVNDNTAILSCTESLESIANLPAILKLDGITGVVAASNDLMLDINTFVGDSRPDALVAERLDTDFMAEQFRQILKIAKEAGKVAGIGGLPLAEMYARWYKEGYRVFMLGAARDGNVEKLCQKLTDIQKMIA